eukprot:scaffold240_cov229-Prasinococcus_capsulatus_cf.AAC.1
MRLRGVHVHPDLFDPLDDRCAWLRAAPLPPPRRAAHRAAVDGVRSVQEGAVLDPDVLLELWKSDGWPVDNMEGARGWGPRRGRAAAAAAAAAGAAPAADADATPPPRARRRGSRPGLRQARRGRPPAVHRVGRQLRQGRPDDHPPPAAAAAAARPRARRRGRRRRRRRRRGTGGGHGRAGGG